MVLSWMWIEETFFKKMIHVGFIDVIGLMGYVTDYV
jgi:hypothetical protein